MKNIIVIPDSFKGTLSSIQICNIIKDSIINRKPGKNIICMPVADGGEGSVDALLSAVGGQKNTLEVHGPYMEKITGFYGMLPDQTAIIEMAAAAGLPLVYDKKNPRITTTYGVGELMLDALEKGAKKLIVGLGGSSTNDGGCGIAAALGIRFLDENGKAFIPAGATLKDIKAIDTQQLNSKLKDIPIICMSDIDNPLCGEKGASTIFGPQKGADEAMIKELDENLKYLATCVQKEGLTKENLQDYPGAGAAGGLGFGMLAFLNAELKMGIDVVLDTISFDSLLDAAELVITGEGKIDQQSLGGKVVVGIGRRAKQKKVPVYAVVGDIGDHIDEIYNQGIAGIFSINRVAVTYKEAKKRAAKDLSLTVDNMVRVGLI